MFRYVLASLKFVFSAVFLEKLWSSNSPHFQCPNCHTRRLKVEGTDVVSEGHQQGGNTAAAELRPSQPDSVGPAPRLPVAALGFKHVPSASCHLPVDWAPHLTVSSFIDICSVLCSLLCLSGFTSSRPLPGLLSQSPSRCPSAVPPSKRHF